MRIIGNAQRYARKVSGVAAWMIASALVFAVLSPTASAQTSLLDPLHGFCPTQCMDNGTNSPTTLDPVTFGFTASPAGSGNLVLDFLVPVADGPPISSVGITPFGVGGLSGTATLFSTTPWTSGDLDTYLKISASPANPIGAFAQGDLLSEGFFVFQVDIGTESLPDPSGTPPEGTSTVPLDTYIVGFLNEGTAGSPDWVATANSGAILDTGTFSNPVPEPSSLLLLGTGALGLAGIIRRRFGR